MKKFVAMITAILIILSLSSCGKSDGTFGDDPTVITIWHIYGAQTDSPLHDLISQFNQTEGKEKGIQVEVTMVSNNNNIHKDILSASNDDPGASELPDIFSSYPKTVTAMPDSNILVNFEDYMTKDELSAFVPEFLADGKIQGKQLILPIAKSTEMLFVNKTIFDRFANATSSKLSDLSSWEGLFETAQKYTRWTDSLTPDIPGDGKPFLVIDSHFNYFQVGVKSLGRDFFSKDGITLSPEFKRAWSPYAKAILEGSVWLKPGYATEPLRTGDGVASVASSASILYYSDRVTYPDNTGEDAEIVALPYPVFMGGEKLVVERGAGMCVVKSTKKREEASVAFLKWLTDAKRNTEFAVKTGYMPVKSKAYENYLPKVIESLTQPKYISLYNAFLQTKNEYNFYIPPHLPSYLSMESRFEDEIRPFMDNRQKSYLAGGQSEDTMSLIVNNSLENFLALQNKGKGGGIK